jgi:G3E family GTPase
MSLQLPIATNLITGFLGVGKTTAVRHLLTQRPTGQRWAVLVNEFGEVGLDGAILGQSEGEGVVVRELAGGCFCCTLSLPLEVSLKELVRLAQPQRLLIESTGLGHPARLLDTLRSGEFARLLQVRATVCITDPRDSTNPLVQKSPVFRDQLHMADVVVINKTDVVPPELTAAFVRQAEELYPPKLLVRTTSQAQVDPAWLDLGSDPLRAPLFPEAHAHHHEQPATKAGTPTPGRPIRRQAELEGQDACGWVFALEDIFDADTLLELLCSEPEFLRLKGVFRVERDEWVLVNRAGAELTVEPIAYRRDSRVEVFAARPVANWDELERRLLACLRR